MTNRKLHPTCFRFVPKINGVGWHWTAIKRTLFQKYTFLQRVSIACYAERCTSYSKSVRPSVRPSVCHTLALCRYDSCYTMGFSLQDTPMTGFRLTSARNSKGNIRSGGAEWERGRKNRQFLANKLPYLRNGARQDHTHNGGLIGSPQVLSIGTKIIDLGWPWTTLNGQNALSCKNMRVLQPPAQIWMKIDPY